MIKIWQGEAVVVVYFEGYDDQDRVKFTRRQETPAGVKSKPKGAETAKRSKAETIAKELAFEHSRKDGEIKREVAQINTAKESGPEVGEGVLDYVTDLIKNHPDAAALEVEILPHRVLTVLAEHEVLSMELDDLEGVRAVMDDYYVEELVDEWRREQPRRVEEQEDEEAQSGAGQIARGHGRVREDQGR
jgi:hypothetical protein